jgi:putative flippase GtrA
LFHLISVDPKRSHIFARFLTASLLTGGLYMLTLFIARTVWGFTPYWSVSAAYIIAMTFYFLANKLVIFATHTGKRVRLELVEFAATVFANYFITLLIVALVVRMGAGVYVGSLAAGAVTMTATYFVFDRLVFARTRR